MTLEELQKKLKGLDAYMITHNNMFIGQDILNEENAIKTLSGFTGSKGTMLVFKNKAYLFVDGRYDIQARQEVNLKKIQVIVGKGEISPTWLSANAKKMKIGFNPWCFTIKTIDKLQSLSQNVKFVESELFGNLVSNKKSVVLEHAIKFSGISREGKISMLVDTIKKLGIDAYFISAADSVSWLLNLRSNCLPHSPVLRAFALVTKRGKVYVFTNEEINIDNIRTFPLKKLEKKLSRFKGQSINACMYQTPQKILSIFEDNEIEYDSHIDPCQTMKAEKTPKEIQNIKQAHIRDGIALSKFLYWIENDFENKTEINCVKKLFELRKKQKHFFSESFDTIAGFGTNSAIVHYKPTEKTDKKLTNNNILLLDSGGQYLDGTTDVTRTIILGKPSKEMITNFTLVLKAHISLANSAFPKNSTSGMKIDPLARKELWKDNKDYSHGTGHGIGYFLNVHEGPNSISSNGTQYPLKANMITSIEPGFYQENKYGIRIENLYMITEKSEGFLQFEHLTLAPIDKNLIDTSMLSQDEINWINAYHKDVFKKLEKHFEAKERVWLKKACAQIK